MSGFVGIVHFDGSPPDVSLLGRMTAFLAFRGPDAQHTWSDGPAGLGHALLRTTPGSHDESQPCSLEGQARIVADARVDARPELIGKLRSAGRRVSGDETDALLLLHAYLAWGEDCAAHVLGDFSFAVWDAGRRVLFCARDHFGVKPFYYGQLGSALLFGNTLEALRLHPGVSDRLDDLAVADFLLFGYRQDLSRTTFADLRCLPPAHSLSCSPAGLRLRRYWSLPVPETIRYRRAAEYTEHFREVFSSAVSDRLRAGRAGVYMSGGLDSTCIAAMARQSGSSDLHAFTEVYDELIPDEERRYAGLAARALGIPIRFFGMDRYRLYERWQEPALLRPEPYDFPLLAAWADEFPVMQQYSRVVLSGHGGDTAFFPPAVYALSLLKTFRWWPLFAAGLGYWASQRRIPRFNLRTHLRRASGRSRRLYPPWLSPDFEARAGLRQRWESFQGWPPPGAGERVEAHSLIAKPLWPHVFGSLDPERTGCGLEFRYPYFDLRVVSFLLAIPPLPWFLDKTLIRDAMRDLLPPEVCKRPKTPYRDDLFLARVRRDRALFLPVLPPAPLLHRYVDAQAFERAWSPALDRNLREYYVHMRPLVLNHWLHALGAHRPAPPAGSRPAGKAAAGP